MQNNLRFLGSNSLINSQLKINYQQKIQRAGLNNDIFSIFTGNNSSIFTNILAPYQKQNKSFDNYIISLADQLVFTAGYNSLFLSYIGNSIFMDKQSMKVFNNIRKF